MSSKREAWFREVWFIHWSDGPNNPSRRSGPFYNAAEAHASAEGLNGFNTACVAEPVRYVPEVPAEQQGGWDLETVSARVHDAWLATKRASGFASRLSESGEELMRPYSELSEQAKELDRATVRAVLAALPPPPVDSEEKSS